MIERILIAIVVFIMSLTYYSTTGRLDLLEEQINAHQDTLSGIFRTKVTVTMYHPTIGQTDDTPNQLADGSFIDPTKATNYRYVALSRDLLSRWGGPIEYGDYIVIEGAGKHSGVYQVRDTMNPRFTRRIDILMTEGTRQFKYNNITLIKYNEDGIDALAWETTNGN